MYLQLDFSSLQKQQEYCFCGETTEPWFSLFMQNQFCSKITYKTSYPIARRLFAMRRYGGGMLYAALPLHMQRDCFRIRTHETNFKARSWREL